MCGSVSPDSGKGYGLDTLRDGDGFSVVICAGICPDAARTMEESSFDSFHETRLSVFRFMTEAFEKEGIGRTVCRDKDALYVLGSFSGRERDVFVGKYVEPVRRRTQEECGTPICMGISTASEPVDVQQGCREARYAFGLYHFEEREIILYRKTQREYQVRYGKYKEDADQAFRSILTRDENVMEKVDLVMDDIEALDYGNWNAAVMRSMIFTGDLGAMLNQYRLLDMDFDEMQDALQARVERQNTMGALKECIHDHIEELITRIYAKGRSQEKVLIEDVKKYIRDHYAEDLSVRELAEVACVSRNYFSAMYKKETGQNYKAYLTSLRMEEALRLLRETDCKVYEIGEKVGYNNVRRFVDAFKRIYTVSPMEYKKRLRNE